MDCAGGGGNATTPQEENHTLSCAASSQKSAELHVSFGSDQQFSSAPVAKATRGWFLEESSAWFLSPRGWNGRHLLVRGHAGAREGS